MKKYIIVNNNQIAGGNNFMTIRKSINNKNVINLNSCQKENTKEQICGSKSCTK